MTAIKDTPLLQCHNVRARKDHICAAVESLLCAVHDERDELRQHKASAPLCEKHQPRGGMRGGCLVCALDEQHAALSRIDYAMGPPNEMGVSGYDVHCAWQAVELRAKHLRFALIGVRETLREMTVRSHAVNDLLEQIELLNL